MENYIALDVLENRVKCLESKILGKSTLDNVNISRFKPVLNTLHEVDTVLISTLSGRDKITSLLKKVDVLEKILDPSYFEVNYNLDSKIETILETESDLVFYNQGLQRLEELELVLNNDSSRKSLDMSDRLNKLTADLLKCKQECDKQSTEVEQLISEYSVSIAEFSKLFNELYFVITKLDAESTPKKTKK